MRINEVIKQMRAQVIAEYLHKVGIKSVLCFSSGNCAKYLKEQGLNVLAVINPQEWYSEVQIARFGLFDATSGNIPLSLISIMAERFLNNSLLTDNALTYGGVSVEVKNGVIELPTGSGESFLVIKMAYPNLKIIPVYNIDEATKYNYGAPLNTLVKILSHK